MFQGVENVPLFLSAYSDETKLRSIDRFIAVLENTWCVCGFLDKEYITMFTQSP
jgi:hypothetical protein